MFERLKAQQYRLIGKHSAVKICHWTKKSLIDEDVCYKEIFYGIKSHRCCQMTPCLLCTNACIYCWRVHEIFSELKLDRIDDPKEMVENAIKAQRHLLNGFPGNPKVNMRKFREAQNPASFAISLSGEPLLYPRISDFLHELRKRRIVSFLVTNGQMPNVIENLNPLPDQLYISLDAPDKETYRKIDKPGLVDFWKRFSKSLELVPSLDTRKVLRITAVKGLNMHNLHGYAKLIKVAEPDFVEIKGYMFVGGSRSRLKEQNMPSHSEIRKFASELSKLINMPILAEKQNSRVVLLGEKLKLFNI